MPQDVLEQLVGDGQARVTCSLELKDSDYGKGFGAFCSVQLTCNQDRVNIRAAQALAQELAEQCMQDAFGAAQALFEESVDQKKRR